MRQAGDTNSEGGNEAGRQLKEGGEAQAGDTDSGGCDEVDR